jgi:nucleosome assembly protein 1-like 1
MSDTEEVITTPGAAGVGAFQNAAMLQALEGRLGVLQGQRSEYIATLPANVRRRLDALKNLQLDNFKIELEFQKKVWELEKQYLKKHQVVYDKRANIITGKYEPTDEECEVRQEDEELPPAPPADPEMKGIPEFWLTALKNIPPLTETITERDEAALKHLIDIKYRYLDEQPGFVLEFHFAPNEFFTNSVLTKTYYLQYSDESPEEVYDHAEGCKIDWKEDKDLSVKVEIKKQRHKATNKTRTVKKTVPCETFFNFFNPPQGPANEDDEIEEDLMEAVEMDYDIGEMIKERLVPNALNWFTGEALEDMEDEYDEGNCSSCRWL